MLTSADPAPARALLAKLRARRHGALLCDAAEVVPNGAMVPLRRFAFEPDAFVAADVPGARLPYDDILGIFRASHHARTETRTEGTSKQFSAGRALLSGGLLVTKNVTREEKSHHARSASRSATCFAPAGDTPWLLRERGTHYAGLGPEAGPSSAQNFVATMARLRKLAPGAVYDERLMNARNAPNAAAPAPGAAARRPSGCRRRAGWI